MKSLTRVFGPSLLAIILGPLGCLEARPWTNTEGRTIEADFVSSDGKTVVLLIDGKPVNYALSKLSPEDQAFVAKASEVATGWIRDFVIPKPAFPEIEDYLSNRNAKTIYQAFDRGNYPESWTANTGNAKEEFHYSDGKAVVYVPEVASKEPLGVYLHISPGDQGDTIEPYAEVMDRMKLIYVSPKGTSNAQPMLRRVKVSVDALAAVREQWRIDPARVYVGGVSGGGHMAMMLHVMYPDLFKGSLSHAAQSYLPSEASTGHFPGIEQKNLKTPAFKGHRWAVISGPKDQNYQEILKSSEKWQAGRFDYRFFDIPEMGHTAEPAEAFETALKWLEHNEK